MNHEKHKESGMDATLEKKEIHIYTTFTQRAVPSIKGEWQELSQKPVLLLY